MRGLIIEDPTAPASLSLAINELLRVKNDLRDVARATAERFTWETYGANLMKLIAGL